MTINRLLWRSRRGALELDLLLIDYVKNRYPHIPASLQQDYERLLDIEDLQLRQWLIEDQPAARAFQSIVKDIIEYARNY